MGVAKCVCCCRRMGRAGTSNRWDLRLRALGAQVRVCAPPDKDFAELLAGAGVPLVPIGQQFRSMVRPSSSADASQRAAELIAQQFDTVAGGSSGS